MMKQELDSSLLAQPFKKYFAATRPAFLLATLVPVLLGLAYAHSKGLEIHFVNACLTILAALTLHASINVLNDYYDSLNGTDDNNEEHIYPFTGGSRFIQNQLLTQRATLIFGISLITVVIIFGTYLTLQVGPKLLWLGLAGIFIGWAYSAPPFKLNSRGLGELSVLIGFSLLPLGAFLVQFGNFSRELFFISLPSGLLTTNLLYINQFPDRKADLIAGKLHWVARLELKKARWGYLLFTLSAYFILIILVVIETLPSISLMSLAPAPISFMAAKSLISINEQPLSALEPAIKMSINAMLLHGFLVTLSLLV